MINYNQQECCTPTEAIELTGMKKSTFYDQLKRGNIKFFNSVYGILIPKIPLLDFKERYFKKSEKIDVNIIQKEDEWLKVYVNVMKLKEWASSNRIKWAEMDLTDYTKYWQYILKPVWIREGNYKVTQIAQPTKKPPKQWFIDNKFKGFITSFERKYLLKYGISTVVEFFDYLVSHNKW